MPKYADYINEQNAPENLKPDPGMYWKQSSEQYQKDPASQGLKQTPIPTYSPEQTPGTPQWAAGHQQTTHQANLFEQVDEIPDQEFKLAVAAAENEYQIANHKAIQTSSNTDQYPVFMQNAKMVHDMQVQDAMMKYQRTQLMFRKYQQDNTLSRENAYDAKMAYIKANPIFRMPQADLKPDKPEFSQEYKDINIGRISDADWPKDIADDTGLNDRQKAEKMAVRKFGKDFDKKVPELRKLIEEQWPQEKEQQQGENIFSKIGKALSQTIQHPKDWISDSQFQRKAQGLPIQTEEGQELIPQQQNPEMKYPEQIPTIKTQEEYNKVTKGKTYKGPDGKLHIKS